MSTTLPVREDPLLRTLENDRGTARYRLSKMKWPLIIIGIFALIVLIVCLVVFSRKNQTECNGFGILYTDFLTKETYCECFPCYYGEKCEKSLEFCQLDAAGDQPYLFEEYWYTERTRESFEISLHQRLTYLPDDWFLITPEVERLAKPGSIPASIVSSIRQIHSTFSNARIEDDYSLVFANGAPQLIVAAIWAFYKISNSSQSLFTTEPFVPSYKQLCDYIPGVCTFTTLPLKSLNDTIELIHVPNLPTGHMTLPQYTGTKKILDLSMYWPSTTSVSWTQYDQDVMVFSLTKLTGHAGSRFAWALVRDSHIAELMWTWISGTSRQPCSYSLMMANAILESFMSDGGLLVQWTHDKMQDRWFTIIEIFKNSTTFTIMSVQNFGFAWIRCDGLSDDQCQLAFRGVGIVVESGAKHFLNFPPVSGVSYCRMNLMLHSFNFNKLTSSLKKLVASYA